MAVLLPRSEGRLVAAHGGCTGWCGYTGCGLTVCPTFTPVPVNPTPVVNVTVPERLPSWEMRALDYDDPALTDALVAGFEPFAIDARGSGVGLGRYVTVYLRRPHRD